MKRPMHLQLPSPMNPDSFRGNQTSYMRSSIRELNRSMQSIEKMIQKTKKLISHSKESSLSRQKIQKSECGIDQEAIIASIECSVRKKGEVINNNKDAKVKIHEAIPQKQVILNKGTKSKHCRSLTGQIQLAIRSNSKSIEKNKENSKISQPFKTQITNNKQINTNIPSKLCTHRFPQSKSKQKSLNSSNPQRKGLLKPNQSPSSSSKKGIRFIRKQIRLDSPSILIEDESMISPSYRTNERYRFKTDHSTQQSSSQSFRMPQQTCVQKKKIGLKVREGGKQSQLISQRSNKSTIQAIKLSTRQQLVDQLARLQTVSATDAERRAKFRLKIKKYGFVERHLSQDEIWQIYDELVASKLPQIKWPIAIVETVYSRMGKKPCVSKA